MSFSCLDSSAWIEIAHDGPNSKPFSKAAEDMGRVVVSTVTVYEVWKYTAINADETRADKLAEMLQQAEVVAPGADICLAAARLSIRHKTAMADSLIYATALARNATLWTQDEDFEGLPNVRYFPKIKR